MMLKINQLIVKLVHQTTLVHYLSIQFIVNIYLCFLLAILSSSFFALSFLLVKTRDVSTPECNVMLQDLHHTIPMLCKLGRLCHLGLVRITRLDSQVLYKSICFARLNHSCFALSSAFSSYLVKSWLYFQATTSLNQVRTYIKPMQA